MSSKPGVFLGTDSGATTSKTGGVWADGTTISTRLRQSSTNSQLGTAAVIQGWADGVAGFLTDMRQRTRSQELQLSMSREAIGSYLGIALETVSRLLHQFDAEKLIRVAGRRVNVLNPDRLRQVADGAWVQ